jgi:hypothetical protein
MIRTGDPDGIALAADSVKAARDGLAVPQRIVV